MNRLGWVARLRGLRGWLGKHGTIPAMPSA